MLLLLHLLLRVPNPEDTGITLLDTVILRANLQEEDRTIKINLLRETNESGLLPCIEDQTTHYNPANLH